MRKWIIEVGIALGIAFGVILIFFGFFLLIVGVLPSFFGPLLMIIGGPMIAAGIIVVLKLVEATKPKWTTVVRIASSATLLFVGLVFLIWFFFASRMGIMLNPLTLLFGGFGGSMLSAGIIVALPLVGARKRKWIIVVRIVSGATLFFFGLFFLTWGGLWGDLIPMIIGGPMMIAGILTLLRTVK